VTDAAVVDGRLSSPAVYLLATLFWKAAEKLAGEEKTHFGHESAGTFFSDLAARLKPGPSQGEPESYFFRSLLG
jgi:hypothetical protein